MERISDRVATILEELRSRGSAEARAGVARFGIETRAAFGVSVTELRKLARPLREDHDLALALWRTGHHEARLLACLVDDPKAVSEDQMEQWVGEFDSWDLCDQAALGLFGRTSAAWQKALEWAGRDGEFVKRAGFALMAGLAIHDKRASDQDFVSLFPVIEVGAGDPRNFVKKAVSWALRQIGKRSVELNAQAVACAERIKVSANDAAGGSRGGPPEARAARWVASDALRELTSDKVRERLSPQ